MPRKARKDKKYSAELKIQAVEVYLSGKGSQREICRKYGILAKRTLEVWIMWYNGHREFKERSRAKGEIYMTKGRKTTQEERAEIVAFCIEHNNDCGLTVETYNESHQPIYSWVGKYNRQQFVEIRRGTYPFSVGTGAQGRDHGSARGKGIIISAFSHILGTKIDLPS